MRLFLIIGLFISLSGCVVPTLSYHDTGRSVRERSTSKRPQKNKPLTVMSFNIRTDTVIDVGRWWPLRKESVAKLIRSSDADVIGIQEADLHQVQSLLEEIPEYAYIGAGRMNGEEWGEMCAVLYKKDAFQKLDSGSFWLSTKPKKPGSRSWGVMFPRMATWAKLRGKSTGRTFYIFNAHLDNMNGYARRNEAEVLREHVGKIAGRSPVVVTGDFNTGEDSSSYDVLLAGDRGYPRLVDTYRAINRRPTEGEGTWHGYTGVARGKRIDWILASDDFSVLSARIDRQSINGAYPSDHFPVIATMTFSKGHKQDIILRRMITAVK